MTLKIARILTKKDRKTHIIVGKTLNFKKITFKIPANMISKMNDMAMIHFKIELPKTAELLIIDKL